MFVSLLGIIVATAQATSASVCTPASGPVALAGLSEASGIAIGEAPANRLWLHNDSGAPVLFAFDQMASPQAGSH